MFVIKAGFLAMFALYGGYGRLLMMVILDAIDRFNLITFLASKLMTLHGKRTSDHSQSHHSC
jgi:hypothetical protein